MTSNWGIKRSLWRSWYILSSFCAKVVLFCFSGGFSSSFLQLLREESTASPRSIHVYMVCLYPIHFTNQKQPFMWVNIQSYIYIYLYKSILWLDTYIYYDYIYIYQSHGDPIKEWYHHHLPAPITPHEKLRPHWWPQRVSFDPVLDMSGTLHEIHQDALRSDVFRERNTRTFLWMIRW